MIGPSTTKGWCSLQKSLENLISSEGSQVLQQHKHVGIWIVLTCYLFFFVQIVRAAFIQWLRKIPITLTTQSLLWWSEILCWPLVASIRVSSIQQRNLKVKRKNLWRYDHYAVVSSVVVEMSVIFSFHFQVFSLDLHVGYLDGSSLFSFKSIHPLFHVP